MVGTKNVTSHRGETGCRKTGMRVVSDPNRNSNRLAGEKSPYLRQHQFNPVEWFPWCEEAFEIAKKQNKPIFLSIGYSTCHWCHVMEKESFEDPFVANLLNQTFVNIKVDREERPDIDNVYMGACQLMNGSGGWPLTIIMTPEQRPFFAATYIPKTTKYGHLGLVDLIPRIHELWSKSKSKVEDSALHITESLKKYKEVKERVDLTAEILHHGYEFHNQIFDEERGGFGDHPKFPSLHHVQFLLRYSDRFKHSRSREMSEVTLKNILAGGIYDQVGGGIHRYSVDQKWFAPHFEKMLYDQAALIRTLSDAYRVSADPIYETMVKLTVEYIERDLLSPEGAFYSGEDADSEGVEGKFYLWKKGEVSQMLGGVGEEFEKVFDLQEPGNFSEHGKESLGNILSFTPSSLERWASDPKWIAARKVLLGYRELRPRPSRDEKILSDWNALAASALAIAGRTFDQPEWIERAVAIASFITTKMIVNGRLMHRYCEGEILFDATLDDYAFLIEALIEIYESTFDPQWLKKADELAEVMISEFWSEEEVVFQFTSLNAERLIVRKAEIYDGSYPSGNSTAVLVLLRLSKLLGYQDFEDVARKTLERLSGNLDQAPGSYAYLLCALDFAFGPSREFVVVGNDLLAHRLVREIQQQPLFRDIIHWRKGDAATDAIYRELVPFLLELKPINHTSTFYLCEDFSCKSPVEITETFIENF